MKILRAGGMASALLLSLGLLACGTQTTLETTWELPHANVGPFTKLAVIGIMKNKQESVAFESAMVQKLAQKGIQAVPGFTFLEGDTSLTRQEMEKRVVSTGADGVLMFKVLALDKSQNYVPPTAFIAPGGYGLDWWDDPFWGYYYPYPFGYWGYWYPAMQVIATPGYWMTSTTYQVQSALYSVAKPKLVWTATSATYNPTSQRNLADSLAGPVIGTLQDDHLVAKK